MIMMTIREICIIMYYGLAMCLDMTHWQTLFNVLKVQGKEFTQKGIGWTTPMSGPVCLLDPYLISCRSMHAVRVHT